MASRKRIKLEDAIRVAKVQVEIDDEAITLERSSGPTECPISEYAQRKLSDDTNLGYEAKYWKRQCELVCEDRSTLERSLLDKLGSVLKRYDHLREYIKTLEASVQETENEHASELDDAIALIDAYKSMTGMTIEGTGSEFTCKVKNAVDRKGTVFCFTLNADNVTIRPRANVSLLPTYLQHGEISCDIDMAPVLVRDTLQRVFDGLQSDDAAEPTSEGVDMTTS